MFQERSKPPLRPGWVVLRPREPDLAESPCMLLKKFSFFLSFTHRHLLNTYCVSGFMHPTLQKLPGWWESPTYIKTPSTTEQYNLGRPVLTQVL